MRRRATIERLRGDLASAHRDLWQLAEDLTCSRAHGRVLQAIIDRQDLTILALWAMVEKAEQQAEEAKPPCPCQSDDCHECGYEEETASCG